MPDPPHEGPGHPPGPPGGEFIFNDDHRREVAEIGGFLELIGSELRTDGETEIGGETIRPTSSPRFVVRHERLPRGERKLLFEIEWSPRGSSGSNAATGDIVSEKTKGRPDGDRNDSNGERDHSSENE